MATRAPYTFTALLVAVGLSVTAPLTHLLAPPALEAQTLTSLRTQVDSQQVRVIVSADGVARTALTQPGQDASAGAGALGLRFDWDHWEVGAGIAIISTADTITSGFGAAILSPGTTQGQAANLEVVRRGVWKEMDLHGYARASQSVWADTAGAASAAVLGVGLLAAWQISASDDSESVGLRFTGGIGRRSVDGDIAGAPALRERLLGSGRQAFWGLEGGFQMEVNNVGASFGASYYAKGNNGTSIPGLTHFQLTFGLRVQGAIIDRVMTRTNDGP